MAFTIYLNPSPIQQLIKMVFNLQSISILAHPTINQNGIYNLSQSLPIQISVHASLCLLLLYFVPMGKKWHLRGSELLKNR